MSNEAYDVVMIAVYLFIAMWVVWEMAERR